LQVATPAWRFTMPADSSYRLTEPTDQITFADAYMAAVKARGIEVIALADHNSHEWIDIMASAGARHGVVVFPGCEVTTGSGADGIHLLVIGELGATSGDFDRLLAGPLGYQAPDNPRFHDREGGREPGSSSRTLVQILEDLPTDYLVIAPHALGNNGIASASSVRGDLRWKALHHHRLNAVDPGDCSAIGAEPTWNNRFRRRELEDFPRLEDVAFVSTSDAYDLDSLGSRFTWIRMEAPTLEALRQAFLDKEARILCDWDGRLLDYPERNPNRIQHAWVSRLELNGPLGNSTKPLSIEFDPRLNVIIGGRGSGKSTVVAAFRQLYSGTSTLPNGIRAEAEKFADEVFEGAELTATHIAPNSQEPQTARWARASGSTTVAKGVTVPTNFRMRVVNQKELFARVTHDRSDPAGPSRSLLAFADEGLGLLRADQVTPDSWWRHFDSVQNRWMNLAREHRLLREDVGQLPAMRARIGNLLAQVQAFDAPEAKARREANDRVLAQDAQLTSRHTEFVELVNATRNLAAIPEVRGELPVAAGEGVRLSEIEDTFRALLSDAATQAEEGLDNWTAQLSGSEWGRTLAAAKVDEAAYIDELQAAGIDPAAYGDVRDQLARLQAVERTLSQREVQVAPTLARRGEAWANVIDALQQRRRQRRELFESVEARSGRLRFGLNPRRDRAGWTNAVRDLLNLRSDAFLDDVPRLADWLWSDEGETERWEKWREALIVGEFRELALLSGYPIRSGWQRRLEQLDETLRLRLAAEIPDDSLQMRFLKDRGDPERDADWQDITQGSPGQRTAAMLAFVLHHGVEPLVLDQPEDDLDTEWISTLVVRELRASRSKRQIIVASHNANIPVNGDAERVIVLENDSGAIQIRRSEASDGALVEHAGAIEIQPVRSDIQNIMEGGIRAFVQREKKYNNEVRETAGWFTTQARDQVATQREQRPDPYAE
jgi:energy-coupling factor transporter ATP-binding protein EcfA2